VCLLGSGAGAGALGGQRRGGRRDSWLGRSRLPSALCGARPSGTRRRRNERDVMALRAVRAVVWPLIGRTQRQRYSRAWIGQRSLSCAPSFTASPSPLPHATP
jgi:hypothetical protein